MSQKRRTFKILFIIFSLLITCSVLFTCSQTPKATIYRDIWGVAHIYADSETEMAFAQGYAQAEDRLEQILRSFRYAEGTMAEAFGEKYVKSDYIQRVWRHAEIAKKNFTKLSPPVQAIINYYVAGIKQYMKDHADKVPDWAPEIYPWHVVAWGRTFIWGWPLGQAMDDLKRGLKEPEPPHHSNQWVVSGTRTASGAPIALIDPHLNFFSSGHWHETRLHAGAVQVSGMSVVGTPFVGLGHNQYISWAATTGGPDCADVYELEINPENKLQYKYDGQWRDINSEEITLRVKTKEGIKEVKKTIERSHYGPLAERRGNKAYAIRCAYENEVGLSEQLYAMNKARNLKEFKEALSMRQFMPQNIMFASVNGNTYYARTGRVPIRPAGYKWNRPVPGNTSKTEWEGIHPHEDLVQITNPETGFMQNCNISPGTMMPNSPLTANKYPDYIYNDPQNRSNPRGKSAIRLLSAEKNLTLERAKQIALDTSVDGFELWQSALQIAFKTNRRSFNDIAKAVDLVSGWNGRLDADNTAAALFRFWRRACGKLHVSITQNNDGSIKTLSKTNEKNMLLALRQAQKFLAEKFGSIEVAWGKTVRLKRGEKTWPVNGGSFGNGVSVLRAAGGQLDPKSGVTTVDRGQSCTTIVLLGDSIRSFSILPFGESDDPQSPHFTDQAKELFSKSKFKPTYFYKNELLKHLESKEELRVPVVK